MSLLKTAALLTSLLLLATAGLYAQGDARKSADFPRSIHRINPGFHINSRFDETKPMLSVDGKTLFFARKHHPQNTGGNIDPQDIFFSTTKDGIHWSEARNSGPAMNTPRADNLCGIIDENRLIFFKPAGKHQGRFVIRESNAGHSHEKLIGPEIINESAYLEAAFSYDGQVVVYTAKTKSNVGYGKDEDERDIYYSVRTLSGWTAPRNLGRVVNTPGDEFSPFLAADGRTLYFASTGHEGFGAADIFVSRRLGDGWGEWSVPENLGPGINTPRFDGYLTLSPSSRIAYMVSTSNSVGKSDIIAVVLAEEHQPSPLLSFNFTTIAANTSAPVRAEIVIANPQGKVIAQGITASDGRVSMFLPRTHPQSFHATFRSPGYSALDTILADSSTNFHAALQSLPTTLHSEIDNILFEKGSAQISRASFSALDSLVLSLKKYPHIAVELRGHTDNVGTLTALKNLSVRRVDAVRRYLLSKGVDPRRISGKAFGGLKPAFENTIEESRRKNRRVELILR